MGTTAEEYIPENDLFLQLDKLPQEVRDILDKHSENWEETYDNCRDLVADLETVGYTCDYYLDAEPFALKKIEK